MYKTSFIALATAVALSLPAYAGTPVSNDSNNTTSVHYADLDLSGSAGANILQQRVRLAARQVCGSAPDVRELQRTATHRACVANAELSAQSQVERVIAQARTVMLASK